MDDQSPPKLDHNSSTEACIAGATGLLASVYPSELEVGGQAVFYATVFDGAVGTLSASAVKWSIADTSIASPSVKASSGRSANCAKGRHHHDDGKLRLDYRHGDGNR